MATFAGSYDTGGVRLNVSGLSALKLILSRSRREASLVMAQALWQEANRIFNETQRRVPVRYGILRGSGYLDAPVITNTGAEVTLGYGGPSIPYAIYVHERVYAPSGRKVRHDAPTTAKFLEEPVLEAEAELGNRMARRMAGQIWNPGGAGGVGPVQGRQGGRRGRR